MAVMRAERDGRTAVDKAVCVMKAFDGDGDGEGGLGVSELARRTGLSKSTTFRLLGLLERNGVVARDGIAYRLRAVVHAERTHESARESDRICEALTPFLVDLYDATRATVQLGVLRGVHVVYLNKLEGHRRLHTPSRIGGRMPAYCTALGKVLLAHDTDATESTLRAPRRSWTSCTIVDEDGLRSELARVRQRGVAIDRGEALESLVCVAGPVRGSRGAPIAAFSISGSRGSFRTESVDAVLRRVCHAASRVSASLDSHAA